MNAPPHVTSPSPQVQTGAIRRRCAYADLAFFAQEFLGLELGEHHIEWSDLVRTSRLLDIQAARGHGKSGFFSYAYPLWASWRTPHNRGMLLSDTSNQTEEFFRIIKEGVEFTDELGFKWRMPAAIDVPDIAPLVPASFERTWTGSRIWFTNGSRFQGGTFGTRPRGRHMPWMVVDDPHGDDATYSEAARVRDVKFFKAALEPMILRGGQLICVGTPLHGDDIHGTNAKIPEWTSVNYPAIRWEDGREVLLWPEFRPREYLETRRRSMGELLFNQEYLLLPASNESSLFPARLFRERPETLATWLRLLPSARELELREWDYYIGCDFAFSATTGADWTVVVVLGVDRHGNRHLVGLHRAKGMPYHQQLRLLEDVAAPYRAAGRLAAVYLEANQAQRIFGDELARLTDLPVHKYTTGVEKQSLARGVPSLRPLFENGKLRLARGDAASREATDVLMAELQAFGFIPGKGMKGMGAHDDTVMALWLADRAVASRATLSLGALMDDDDVAGRVEPVDLRPRATVGQPFEGEIGKALMIREGYVPATCTLPAAIAGPLIWRETNGGRSPCWTCAADRTACRGEPRQFAPMRLPGLAALGVEDSGSGGGSSDEGAVEPPLREWLDAVEACGGDEGMARTIPQARGARIDGWNALMASGASPEWVEALVAAGKGDALFEALRRLLGLAEQA